MRGCGHKDMELTRLRHEIGVYQDPNSYASTTLLPASGKPKEFLFGIDISRRRYEVWERDGRRCVKCKTYVTFEQMEMDHIERRPFGDDSMENLQTMCGPFQNKCHTGGKESKHP